MIAEIQHLIIRDLKNILNKRILFVFGFITVLMIFIVSTAGNPEKEVFVYTLSFLPLAIFGSFLAIVISFDMVSKDRESKVMDFFLTTPIAKNWIITSKLIVLFSIIFSISTIYCLISLLINGVKYNIYNAQSLLILFLSVFIILTVYGLWAFLCSIVFKKSRTSFLISALVFLFKPQLTNALFSKLFGDILGMKAVHVECILTFFPEYMALSLQKSFSIVTLCALVIYCLLLSSFIFLSYKIFNNQEELSYE